MTETEQDLVVHNEKEAVFWQNISGLSSQFLADRLKRLL
jgi:hypothetical protein